MGCKMNIVKKVLNRAGFASLVSDVKETNQCIALMDTSIGSLNVGDEIINDACRKVFKQIFPSSQHVRLSTHDGISAVGINRANIADFRFVCGSNILNSNLLYAQQWNYSPLDFFRLKPLVLLGVGWSNYQNTVSLYSQLIYRNKLFKKSIHSVRDTYTEDKMRSIGVDNVINTGCPTMWGLTMEHCKKIPNKKSNGVVFTLTDYRKNHSYDEAMVKMLLDKYENVYFWIQGSRDWSYFQTLNSKIIGQVKVIPPRLDDYDDLLVNHDVDFVGTRLHAGIRAMQHSKRTIIIGVDNRAIEKQKDFNLPVVQRADGVRALTDMVDGFGDTDVKLNIDAISTWKTQFKVEL